MSGLFNSGALGSMLVGSTNGNNVVGNLVEDELNRPDEDKVNDVIDSYGGNGLSSADTVYNNSLDSGTLDYLTGSTLNHGDNLDKLFPQLDLYSQAQIAFNQDSANKSMAFNAWQYDLDRQYNSAERAKEREWYEQMSNSAYQRSVEDMRKAGLNPMLLAGRANSADSAYGSGASHSGSGGVSASTTGLSSSLSSLLNDYIQQQNMVNGGIGKLLGMIINLGIKSLG